MILRVACPEQLLRLVMLWAAFENLGGAAQHDPAEAAPILVIVINDKRRLRIFQNVAHPLQRHVAALRLLVDRDVKRVLGHRITYRDHMRGAATVGGSEMADPALVEEPALYIGEHRAILPD